MSNSLEEDLEQLYIDGYKKGRADERERLIKQGQCKDCPHRIGDITERDCCFPDCVGGWEKAYLAKCAELADERERCVQIIKDRRLRLLSSEQCKSLIKAIKAE